MRNVAVAGVMGLSLLASHASAAIVSVIYTGTVTDDGDLTGEFGIAGGSDNLDGDAYTAKYVFDTSRGGTYSSPEENYALGGTLYGNASPVLSASVTVNGHTQSVVGSYEGEISGLQDIYVNYGEQHHLAEDYSSTADGYTEKYLESIIYGSDLRIPATITGPFKFTTNASDNSSSYYLDSIYNYDTGYQTDTYVDAHIATLTVSSGVPEPATWALMALGFAGLGFAGYRRSKSGQRALISA